MTALRCITIAVCVAASFWSMEETLAGEIAGVFGWLFAGTTLVLLWILEDSIKDKNPPPSEP